MSQTVISVLFITLSIYLSINIYISVTTKIHSYDAESIFLFLSLKLPHCMNVIIPYLSKKSIRLVKKRFGTMKRTGTCIFFSNWHIHKWLNYETQHLFLLCSFFFPSLILKKLQILYLNPFHWGWLVGWMNAKSHGQLFQRKLIEWNYIQFNYSCRL